MSQLLKSQAGVEFIILASMVFAIAVIILSNAFKEMELNLAVASVRNAGEQIALSEGVTFYNVSYYAQDGTVFLKPFFSDGTPNQARVDAMAGYVKAVIAPNADFEQAGVTPLCFSTTRRFCVG